MFHSLPIFSHPPKQAHRRGPLLTRGGSENPVEQADGDGQQNDQRPDHTL